MTIHAQGYGICYRIPDYMAGSMNVTGAYDLHLPLTALLALGVPSFRSRKLFGRTARSRYPLQLPDAHGQRTGYRGVSATIAHATSINLFGHKFIFRTARPTTL